MNPPQKRPQPESMTRKFNVYYTCQHCGKQTTAETAFGRWMRANPALDSADGIVRTDCDHIVWRYKTYTDGRDFQLGMIVETKEYGAEPDPSQRDVLLFMDQIFHRHGSNMHGAKTDKTLKLKSHMSGREVLVRFLGVHLLQFEKTNPDDSAWIKWDRKHISAEMLTEILALNRRPDKPRLEMEPFLRDRHRKDIQPFFPQLAA